MGAPSGAWGPAARRPCSLRRYTATATAREAEASWSRRRTERCLLFAPIGIERIGCSRWGRGSPHLNFAPIDRTCSLPSTVRAGGVRTGIARRLIAHVPYRALLGPGESALELRAGLVDGSDRARSEPRRRPLVRRNRRRQEHATQAAPGNPPRNSETAASAHRTKDSISAAA
jgi:hypothetical protein